MVGLLCLFMSMFFWIVWKFLVRTLAKSALLHHTSRRPTPFRTNCDVINLVLTYFVWVCGEMGSINHEIICRAIVYKKLAVYVLHPGVCARIMFSRLAGTIKVLKLLTTSIIMAMFEANNAVEYFFRSIVWDFCRCVAFTFMYSKSLRLFHRNIVSKLSKHF